MGEKTCHAGKEKVVRKVSIHTDRALSGPCTGSACTDKRVA